MLVIPGSGTKKQGIRTNGITCIKPVETLAWNSPGNVWCRIPRPTADRKSAIAKIFHPTNHPLPTNVGRFASWYAIQGAKNAVMVSPRPAGQAKVGGSSPLKSAMMKLIPTNRQPCRYAKSTGGNALTVSRNVRERPKRNKKITKGTAKANPTAAGTYPPGLSNTPEAPATHTLKNQSTRQQRMIRVLLFIDVPSVMK
jgi:hypothetical protein